MTPIYVDYETYWAQGHSLTNMTAIEYVTHPDTEIISVAFKIGKGQTCVVFGEDRIREVLSAIDWSDKLLIAHNNSEFDALISAWRFGIKPAMWGCTLAMARPIHAKGPGGSLKKLAEHYGLQAKGSLEATNTKGKHLCDFTPGELKAMEEYNKIDTDICAELFAKLLPQTPKDEMRLIDMTIRMLVEPQLEADMDLLKRGLRAESKRKAKVLQTLADELGSLSDDPVEEIRATLASAPKFKAFLEAHGVEVEMKVSPTTGRKTPALAKTDTFMERLLEHEDDLVAAAAAARLDTKSTILETRLQRFIDTATACNGKMPIALRYYGADTTGRWSGTMNLNQQNLPRINPKKAKLSDVLRKSLRAPEGYSVVVADLSGIELRVNHFLWKEPSSMELYQQDAEADLYKAFAASMYDITQAEVTKDQRHLAKLSQLGLGFGSGYITFQNIARLMGGINLSDTEAMDVVEKWRGTYARIAQGWKTCHSALPYIRDGREMAIDPWGMCVTCAEGIRTPKGMIRYPDLRQETDEKTGKQEWWYGNGRSKSRIYAGKIDENCLAEGTLVLTDRGWVSIESIALKDKVFDGVEFVSHTGIICKSVQDCVNLDGVWLTNDHEVLTNDGWQTASQLQRLDGPEIRYVDRDPAFAQHWENLEMGVPVRLRQRHGEDGAGRVEGSETRRDAELRLQDPRTYRDKELNARNDQTPGLRCVPQHGGSLSLALASGVAQLRGAWDNGLRAVVGGVRELLGRHGADVSARANPGSFGQQRPIFAGELPLDFYARPNDEQAGVNTRRRYTNTSEGGRNKPFNAVLPSQAGVTAASGCGQTQSHKVYDILNAGPRHRFVVLGESGPFIAHNCVQHLARHVITDVALKFAKTKWGKRYPLAHSVHDELVYVVDDDHAVEVLRVLQDIMRTPPDWWPELITWSEGDIAQTYGSAK